MSEETFRTVVTIAAVLACLSFMAQAFVIVGLYAAIRRLQAKFEPLIQRAEPIVAKIGPVVDSVKQAVDSAKPGIDKAADAAGKVGPILDNVHKMVAETRPRVAEVSTETVAIVKTARKQVERAGDLLEDAGERAKSRLAQIDRTVESTVDQVEQVGDTVKRAVMKPVREVNGIAAGVSAAVSTMVHGGRRPTVESATADEEMFI